MYVLDLPPPQALLDLLSPRPALSCSLLDLLSSQALLNVFSTVPINLLSRSTFSIYFLDLPSRSTFSTYFSTSSQPASPHLLKSFKLNAIYIYLQFTSNVSSFVPSHPLISFKPNLHLHLSAICKPRFKLCTSHLLTSSDHLQCRLLTFTSTSTSHTHVQRFANPHDRQERHLHRYSPPSCLSYNHSAHC